MITNVVNYEHIAGIFVGDGDTESVLAVHAVCDPSPNMPAQARIIVGSPKASSALAGDIPSAGGFCMSPDVAERLILVLQTAVRDVREAMRSTQPS